MDNASTLELNNPNLGYNPSFAAGCEFMNQFLHSPEPPCQPLENRQNRTYFKAGL